MPTDWLSFGPVLVLIGDTHPNILGIVGLTTEITPAVLNIGIEDNLSLFDVPYHRLALICSWWRPYS